jgi:hypothetical protein
MAAIPQHILLGVKTMSDTNTVKDSDGKKILAALQAEQGQIVVIPMPLESRSVYGDELTYETFIQAVDVWGKKDATQALIKSLLKNNLSSYIQFLQRSSDDRIRAMQAIDVTYKLEHPSKSKALLDDLQALVEPSPLQAKAIEAIQTELMLYNFNLNHVCKIKDTTKAGDFVDTKRTIGFEKGLWMVKDRAAVNVQKAVTKAEVQKAVTLQKLDEKLDVIKGTGEGKPEIDRTDVAKVSPQASFSKESAARAEKILKAIVKNGDLSSGDALALIDLLQKTYCQQASKAA